MNSAGNKFVLTTGQALDPNSASSIGEFHPKENIIVKNNYLKTSLFFPITYICLTNLLLSFVSVQFSVFLGILLSSWLILRAKPDGILGLLLLYFMRYNFYSVDFFEGFAPSFDTRETFSVAGFPMEVQTVACGFIALRVLLEKIYRPETFKSKFPKIIFRLWIISFLPVLVGLFIAIQDSTPNWSGGLRFLLISGSYFYGYILAKNWPQGGNAVLMPILLPLVVIMLLLMNLFVFWSHHGFLFLGLGGAFFIYYTRSQLFRFKFLGALLLFLIVIYAIKGTLTMIGIVLLSIYFSYLGNKKLNFSSIIRSKKIKLVGEIAISGIFFVTAVVTYIGFQKNFDQSVSYGSYTGTINERIEAKTLSDRLPLWSSALQQVLSGPYFIVPSGRPLLVKAAGYPDQKWLNGSHNTILEALRINGLFAGTTMLIIIFLALKNNVKVLANSADPVLNSLASGVLGVSIPMMTMNNIPIDMTIGFFLWSLAGLCHGLFLQSEPFDRTNSSYKLSKSQLLASEPKQILKT